MKHHLPRSFSPVRVAAGLAFLLAVLAFALPSRVSASVAVPLTVEEMSAIADDIVHATVETSETDLYKGKIFTRHTLRVEESLKGTAEKGGTMQTVTLGGRMGKIASVSPGLAQLQEGEEVILFVSKPAEKLKRRSEAPVEYDMESPFIQNSQIIGGFQGKFSVVRQQVEHEAPGGRRMTSETVRVFRAAPGRHVKPTECPTLKQFKDQVRMVASDQVPVRRSEREIATVGKVAVSPENDAHQALRFFDPLPRRAAKARAAQAAAKPQKPAAKEEQPKTEEPKDENTPEMKTPDN